jgi:hypothetical protein
VVIGSAPPLSPDQARSSDAISFAAGGPAAAGSKDPKLSGEDYSERSIPAAVSEGSTPNRSR